MQMLTTASLQNLKHTTTEIPGPAKSFEEYMLGSEYVQGDFTTVTLSAEDYQPNYRVRYGAQDEQYFFVRKHRYMPLRNKIASLFINCVVYEAVGPIMQGLNEKTRLEFGTLLSDNYVIVPYYLDNAKGAYKIKTRGMHVRTRGRGRVTQPLSALIAVDMALNGIALNKENSLLPHEWNIPVNQSLIRDTFKPSRGNVPLLLQQFEDDVLAYTAQQLLALSTGTDYKG